MLVAGCFVFGVSGGLAGVEKKLDYFGVTVLASIVGLAGGAIRDVCLGIPATTVLNWHYVAAVVSAGTLAFWAHRPLLRWHASMQILDAIGLSLFSVVGTDISLSHHAGPVPAVILGMATAIGGGVIRDIMLREIPWVFRSDLYAVPALAASTIVVVAHEIHHATIWWYIAAMVVCFVTRLIGIIFNVSLPRAKPSTR
jgi:uncharacterized membrane protein YeiH